MPDHTDIGELLGLLDELLAEAPDGRGGALADDPAVRRKVARVKVGFEALRALESKARFGSESGVKVDGLLLTLMVEIRHAELRLAVSRLATEALAYRALPMPDERPGDNEAPVGGAYAQLARQGMLADLFEQAETLDTKRDRLARQLLRPLGNL